MSRGLTLVAVVLVAAALLAGCGGSSDSGTSSTSAAEASSAHAADQELAAAAEAKRLRRELAAAKAAKAAQDAQGNRGAPAKDPSGEGDGGSLLGSNAAASFAALEQDLGGASGLAVAPAGAGQALERVGSLSTGPAWSTMKVPVVLAAQAAGSADSATVARAITASDNAAAQELWDGLGSPAQAGDLVQRQLAAAGDADTAVQTKVTRPGFSSFGQTIWPLDAQARFVGGLACESSAQDVLGLMKQVEGDQRWGLGTLPGSPAFKGGWGPDTDGAYFVRQMGIVPIGGRPVALTIATTAADGSFDTGTAHLSRIAAWAAAHVKTTGLPSSPAC